MSQFILSAFADEIDMDLKTQMDVLDSHGIKFIEMRGVNGRNISEYTAEEAKAIKKQLDDRGFKVSAIGSPIGKIKITDSFDEHLKLFKKIIEIAKILDTKYIRMFSFFMPEGEKAENYRDEVLRRWQLFIRAAEGSGLILLHENEKEIYGDTPERCKDLLDSLNCPYLRATFDPANFIQCDCETIPHSYDLLKDHIEYVHIKDANQSDHKVVPAGYGDGRVPELLKILKDIGYNGFLSLEPHLGGFKGFEKLEPSSPYNKMEEGGEKAFAIAVGALKKILNTL